MLRLDPLLRLHCPVRAVRRISCPRDRVDHHAEGEGGTLIRISQGDVSFLVMTRQESEQIRLVPKAEAR